MEFSAHKTCVEKRTRIWDELRRSSMGRLMECSKKRLRLRDNPDRNDQAQQRRGPTELRTPETLHAPAVCGSAWFGVPCCLGLGCHVGPQGFASYFAVSAGLFRCHVRKESIVLCLPLVSQRRWAETLLVPLRHSGSGQDRPLH